MGSTSKDYPVCDPCRAKKIRCGRERPHCNNCTRLGHECTWSGHGKKPSQAVTVAHTIGKLEDRLDRIESGVEDIRRAVQKGLAPQDITWNKPASQVNLEPSSTGLPTTFCSESSALPGSPGTQPWPAGQPRFRHRARTGDGDCRNWEPCTGPTTLDSILLDVKEFILEPVCNDPAHGLELRQAATCARQRLDAILNVRNKHSLPILDDSMEPEAPPVPIVEAMTEPYFLFINPHMPIWTRQAFGRLAEACQMSGSVDRIETQYRASIVCVNNMVLLTLTAKLLKLKSKKRASNNLLDGSRRDETSDKQRLSPMELDLLKTFLANARRALNRIEQLLFPRIASIQAFLSLCLVAQNYLTEDVFSLLFHQAAYLARVVGLEHTQQSTAEIGGDDVLAVEDVQERHDLLLCLRMIGSSVAWASGLGPNLILSNTASMTPGLLACPEYQKPTENDHQFRLSLTRIEDKVFTLVMSSTGLGAEKPHEIQHAISVLHRRLQTLMEHNEDGTSASGAGADGHNSTSTPSLDPMWSSSFHTERSICLHTLRILMAWAGAYAHQDSRSTTLEVSRRCLKAFADALRVECDIGVHANLTRLLISYPPVAFVQVFAHVVNGECFSASTSGPSSTCTGAEKITHDDQDLDLLQTFTKNLQAVADLGGGDASSHVARLGAFANVLTSFAADCRRPVLQQRGAKDEEEVAKEVGTRRDSAVFWSESSSGGGGRMHLDLLTPVTRNSIEQQQANTANTHGMGIEAFTLHPGSPLSGFLDHFPPADFDNEFLGGDPVCYFQ